MGGNIIHDLAPVSNNTLRNYKLQDNVSCKTKDITFNNSLARNVIASPVHAQIHPEFGILSSKQPLNNYPASISPNTTTKSTTPSKSFRISSLSDYQSNYPSMSSNVGPAMSTSDVYQFNSEIPENHERCYIPENFPNIIERNWDNISTLVTSSPCTSHPLAMNSSYENRFTSWNNPQLGLHENTSAAQNNKRIVVRKTPIAKRSISHLPSTSRTEFSNNFYRESISETEQNTQESAQNLEV